MYISSFMYYKNCIILSYLELIYKNIQKMCYFNFTRGGGGAFFFKFILRFFIFLKNTFQKNEFTVR